MSPDQSDGFRTNGVDRVHSLRDFHNAHLRSGRSQWLRGWLQRVAPPRLVDTLELLLTGFGEGETRPGDEVLHSARHHGLVRAGQARDTGGDVDSDAGDVVLADLDLAGVEAGANGEVELLHRRLERDRAGHRATRTVEGREDAIPGRLHQVPVVFGDDPACHGVVTVQQFRPGPVTGLRHGRRRVDDVGE